MAIFHFPQCEQELFYRYWECLHAYLAQCAFCGYLYGKWEILHVVDEGVNCETRALLEHWDFCTRNIDVISPFLFYFCESFSFLCIFFIFSPFV